MIINPVIIGFSPNKEISNFHLCDHSIITVEKIGFYLGYSNNYNVYILDRFRKLAIEKVHNSIEDLKENSSKEAKKKLRYANKLINNMELVDSNKYLYWFEVDK